MEIIIPLENTLQLDEFFFNIGLTGNVSINEFESIMSQLEQVYGIVSSRSTLFIMELKRRLKNHE